VDEGVSGLLVPVGDPEALARAVERYFQEGLGEALAGRRRARPRALRLGGLVDAIESLAAEIPG